MNVNSDYQSPNFESVEIPVEFLVLHYTGCDLKKTLEIFMDPKSKVAAHFVIDETGFVYDLGHFLEEPIRKGAHAGKSKLSVSGKLYKAFNEYSIGIEIVNLNGNIFDFTEAQYLALNELIKKLQSRFPNLLIPERIVGHEHVAFWRGKCDPGIKFDWPRLYKSLEMKLPADHKFNVCDESDLIFLKEKIESNQGETDFWPQLSLQLEKRIAERESAKISH